MDWGLIGTILAIVFGITTIVLAIVTIRTTRRKKPVWAYQTKKIVGLGSDAPVELKLFFGGVPVNEVYETSLIFFNKGIDIIDKNDVTDDVTIHFKEARILRQPNIKAISNDKIRFLAKQVVKEGDNAVQLSFLYLGHRDGAVIEVMHSESPQIRHTGNVKGVDIVNIGEFEPSKASPKVNKLVVSSVITVFTLSLIILAYSGLEIIQEWIAALYLFLGMFGFILTTQILERIRYGRFPQWSRFKK